MRITTKSKYGMRMIVEIAAQPEGKAASLKAIARKINASEKYLEPVSYTHLHPQCGEREIPLA